MPADTRKRLLEAALWRFYRDGFRNVGLTQILDDVGISKTAFCKHFESKDELMVAALDEHTAHMAAQLREAAVRRGGDDPADCLPALFDLVEHYAGMDGIKGCIFVNVSMEFPLPHDPSKANRPDTTAPVRIAQRRRYAEPRANNSTAVAAAQIPMTRAAAPAGPGRLLRSQTA